MTDNPTTRSRATTVAPKRYRTEDTDWVRLCPRCGRIQLGANMAGDDESSAYWHADGSPDTCKPRDDLEAKLAAAEQRIVAWQGAMDSAGEQVRNLIAQLKTKGEECDDAVAAVEEKLENKGEECEAAVQENKQLRLGQYCKGVEGWYQEYILALGDLLAVKYDELAAAEQKVSDAYRLGCREAITAAEWPCPKCRDDATEAAAREVEPE